ncbi:MAG: hypothetical protein ACTSW7_00780 [Candidatus Thorarchaeota archaeon]|nr:hypothetical protein [Thermoplasmatales archaeon]
MKQLVKDCIRQHMLDLEEIVYQHDELSLTLKRILCCMVDDIVNFVSNAIQEKYDHEISNSELDKEYLKYKCIMDEKVKELICYMVRLQKEIK